MEDSATPFTPKTYTKSQLHRYLKYISYPNPNVLPPPTFATLGRLMAYHLAKVPFENLVIHYSPHHSISLDSEHLFQKIVERGHGGYCMENNGFFSIALRSLGFDIWTVGGKVSATVGTQGVDRSGMFLGFNHMVCIVAIDGQEYQVDVGFGSGPLSPIPMIPGVVTPGAGTEQFRLLQQPLRYQTNRSLPFWILQNKSTSEGSWLDLYAFSPHVELSQEDYEVLSYYTSTNENTIMTKIIICIRTILSSELSKEELEQAGEKEGEVKAVGRMILVGRKFKKNIGDVAKESKILETEEQRVQVLKKYFNIELTEKEQVAIRGGASEII